MKTLCQVRFSENGDLIDVCPNRSSAEQYIENMEEEDRKNDEYEEDYYEIKEVPEYRFAVIRTDYEDNSIDSYCLGETFEECITFAENQWCHLTRLEQKKNEVIVGSVKADYEMNGNVWEIFYKNGVDFTQPVETTATVGQNGNSLTVPITDVARKLEIEKGDTVKLMIQKVFRV